MTKDQIAEVIARAWAREEAAQMGEPDPWQFTDETASDTLWRQERRACASAVYDALQAAGMIPKWQPIETAPKDEGGPSLLLLVNGHPAVGFWLEEEWVPGEALVALTAFIEQPTRWMPIPDFSVHRSGEG